MRITFDPGISEWGNPPEYVLLLLRNNAHSVPAQCRYTDAFGIGTGLRTGRWCGDVIIRMYDQVLMT